MRITEKEACFKILNITIGTLLNLMDNYKDAIKLKRKVNAYITTVTYTVKPQC